MRAEVGNQRRGKSKLTRHAGKREKWQKSALHDGAACHSGSCRLQSPQSPRKGFSLGFVSPLQRFEQRKPSRIRGTHAPSRLLQVSMLTITARVRKKELDKRHEIPQSQARANSLPTNLEANRQMGWAAIPRRWRSLKACPKPLMISIFKLHIRYYKLRFRYLNLFTRGRNTPPWLINAT